MESHAARAELEINDAIVSKTAFADLVGVTPGRVTQWISAGQIDGDALVGSGRWAQIRVVAAIDQLRQRLDINHRVHSLVKATLDGIPGAVARPVLSQAQLDMLVGKLSVAITEVLLREFVIEQTTNCVSASAETF